MPEQSASVNEMLTGSECAFCGKYASRDDAETYKEVRVWVHGPKSDGAVLREETGRHAHSACVLKIKQGQAPDQDYII